MLTFSDEILSMANTDQAMRNQHRETDSWDDSIDKHNTLRLKEIIAKQGWPTISMVGEEVAFATWILVQHADLDPKFQSECLELIHQLPKGEITPDNLAHFEDRVRVNTGKPQLYGTQFSVKSGAFGPLPIEDREHLEERRRDAGLSSFEEYTAEMREIYEKHERSPIRKLKAKAAKSSKLVH